MSGPFQFGQVTPLRYFLSIAVVLGLLFAMIKTPDEQSMWVAIWQWQLQSVPPMLLLIASHMALHQWRRFDQFNVWLQLFLSGIMGALLFTPLALSIDYWLQGEVIENRLLEAMTDEFFGMAPPVVVTWIAINVPWVLGFRVIQAQGVQAQALQSQPLQASTPNEREPAAVQSDAQPDLQFDARSNESSLESLEFIRLLPKDIFGELVYLQAELHYLRVVTLRGSALILYNLKDAITELPENIGIQTHRSFWVALSQVERLDRSGRQGTLQLKNGDSVPVSRNRLQQVQQALSLCINT